MSIMKTMNVEKVGRALRKNTMSMMRNVNFEQAGGTLRKKHGFILKK